MNTIKLKAPDGVTSASVNGQQFEAAKDGTIEVPAEIALQLYGFGFSNVTQTIKEEKPADVASTAKPIKR